MISDISKLRDQFDALSEAYQSILSELDNSASASDEERVALDRIGAKLSKAQAVIAASDGSSKDLTSPPAAEEESEKRKRGRLDRLQAMRASLSDMMTSLKAAR